VPLLPALVCLHRLCGAGNVYNELLVTLKKRIIAFLVPIRMTPNAVKKIEQFDKLGGFTEHPFGQVRDEDMTRD